MVSLNNARQHLTELDSYAMIRRSSCPLLLHRVLLTRRQCFLSGFHSACNLVVPSLWGWCSPTGMKGFPLARLASLSPKLPLPPPILLGR